MLWDEDQRPLTQGRSQQVPGSPGLDLIGYRYPTLETYVQRLRREAPRWARAIAQEVERDRAAGGGAGDGGAVTGTTVTSGASDGGAGPT